MRIDLCIYKVHDRCCISTNASLYISSLVTLYLHYFVRFIKEHLIYTSNLKYCSCNHIETKNVGYNKKFTGWTSANDFICLWIGFCLDGKSTGSLPILNHSLLSAAIIKIKSTRRIGLWLTKCDFFLYMQRWICGPFNLQNIMLDFLAKQVCKKEFDRHRVAIGENESGS